MTITCVIRYEIDPVVESSLPLWLFRVASTGFMLLCVVIQRNDESCEQD